jgi:hypothetical protein
MKSPTYLIWLRRLIVLGAVVAGTMASTAGAFTDVRDTGGSIGQAYLGSPPDVVDIAATANLAVPDVLERYATAHPYGSGLSLSAPSTVSSPSSSTLVSRPPDVSDAASAAQSTGVDRITLVSRPPDVSDAALAAETGSLSQSSGFHWGDWAIGIGTGMGLIILLAAGLAMGRQVRQPVQTA